MNGIRFDHYRVNSRMDLLHFIEEHGVENVCERIGEDPDAWFDELEIVSQLLTRNPLVGGNGLNQPPIGEPDFKELGKGVFIFYCPYKSASLGYVKKVACPNRNPIKNVRRPNRELQGIEHLNGFMP